MASKAGGKQRQRVNKTTQKQTAKVDKNLRDAILTARANRDLYQIDLVKGLSEAKKSESYRDWDWPTFKDYIGKEVGLAFSTVNRWLQIWDKVQWLKLSEERMRAMGWHKLVMLTSVADEKNKKDLLKTAETKTLEELTEVVKSYKVVSASSQGAGMSIKISGGSVQLDIINNALKRAGELTKSPKDAELNLGLICQEWMTTQIGAVPVAMDADNVLKHLNTVYPGSWTYSEDDVDLNAGLGEEEELEDTEGEENLDEGDEDGLDDAIDSLGDLEEEED